ncbi:uncharacterized protein [Mytilus edulis]|uniref:uncharacterized protein isoform X1 n=1 Tax=Mytilus edulis TaxID=6550 RepID=UPI0039EFC31E
MAESLRSRKGINYKSLNDYGLPALNLTDPVKISTPRKKLELTTARILDKVVAEDLDSDEEGSRSDEELEQLRKKLKNTEDSIRKKKEEEKAVLKKKIEEGEKVLKSMKVMKKRVLILCDSIGKYLDGMKDTVVQSFSGANLGYIKYVIDKEYIYLHEFDSFSHVILHFGTNDIEKHSIEIILCKFRNLIYSVRNRNRDINILISSILPRPVDFVQLGYKVVQINKALIGICKDEKISFTKSYRRFLFKGSPKRDLFAIKDGGLHLNEAGVAQLKMCFIHVISYL